MFLMRSLFFLLLVFFITSNFYFKHAISAAAPDETILFKQAPQFYNSPDCSDQAVHVAMTLDTAYIRGSMAAVLSALQHSSCPENIAFHFVASANATLLLRSIISSSFPYLNFRVYSFLESSVARLISASIRSALDCPLNYARSYLADLLPLCIRRVVYLDSDLVLVDDIAKLAAMPLGRTAVLAAPEYCNANFTAYFMAAFWSSPSLSKTFADRKPCYFNTGVMVMDLARWRGGWVHGEDRGMDGAAKESEDI